MTQTVSERLRAQAASLAGGECREAVTMRETADLIDAKDALIDELVEALACSPIIASSESSDRFRARQDIWLKTRYAKAMDRAKGHQP